MQKIEYIHISVLHPHPDNPRKDLGDLTELADSIKAKGVLQNLTVVPDREAGGYRIVIGHRRHAAAKLAGLTDLPCVIADMTPQEQFETMMVENVQRSDLTVYEQAEGFQLMLDMGSSVEEVAKKTGFSETTIRNRVKLTRLDKEKFRKAEQRGATLTDYMKLNEIKDPQKRNQVLDAIGTPNFNYELKSALEDQKFAEEYQAVLAALQAAAWCKERTDENITFNGDYDTCRYFDRYNRKPITTMPSDLDQASYIYTASANTIWIYRKGPKANKKGKTAEQEKKDRYSKKADNIHKQLEAISKTHREMRQEFIENFSTFNNDQMGIEAFAAKALLAYAYGTPSHEILSKVSGIPMVEKNTTTQIVDPKVWNGMLFNNPIRALLYAAYVRMDRYGLSYATRMWNDKVSFSVPKHQKEDSLDLLYECLVSLGYEMSDDEILMQNGKHPLFKEAADLVAEFKKEKV